MFTGIIRYLLPIKEINRDNGLLTIAIDQTSLLKSDPKLSLGDSVAINGVCLTISNQIKDLIYFDIIETTQAITNLSLLKLDQLVHVELSAKVGESIGGHLLSGHIFCTAPIIEKIDHPNLYTTLSLQSNDLLSNYLFIKGYIAIEGVSLTLFHVDDTTFTIKLVPHTISETLFKYKSLDDLLNIEIDSTTQSIVDTTTQFLKNNTLSN